MFHEDLLAVLQRWREKGDRVVLIMDMNENVIDGTMYKQLAGEDLQMREVSASHARFHHELSAWKMTEEYRHPTCTPAK